MHVAHSCCRCPLLFGCLAAALAGAAPAYAGEGGETGFQIQLVADQTVLTPENPTATITLMMGWFGEGGFGPAIFDGALLSDSGVMSIGGAVDPFVCFACETQSGTALDVFVGRLPVLSPPPPDNPPPPYGVDELVPVFSFTATALDFDGSTITLTATGESRNISQWNFLLGLGAWVANAGDPQSGTATLVIPTIPAAPSAVFVLFGGAVIAGRSFAHFQRRRPA